MTGGEPNPKVDWYFAKATTWHAEVAKLRELVLGSGLQEELKWGVPCYTLDGANIVLIHTFKNYCALLFHKGVLLQDSSGILIQQTVHVQSARQLRFTNLEEIKTLEATIKAYIDEAIEVEKAGLTVDFVKTTELSYPEEFQSKIAEMPGLKEAFEALTPGRQRAYIIYFSNPKQSKTRAARVDKCSDMILDGIGLFDNGR